jgi:hypothetical protein
MSVQSVSLFSFVNDFKIGHVIRAPPRAWVREILVEFIQAVDVGILFCQEQMPPLCTVS